MAGETARYAEWLNRNAHRAYPFREDSPFGCEGGVSLPMSAVLDLRLCLSGPPRGEVSMVRMDVSGGEVSAVFSDGDWSMSVSGHVGRRSADGGEESYHVAFGDVDDGSYVLLVPLPVLPSRVVRIPYGLGVDSLKCGYRSAVGTVGVADGVNTRLDVVGNRLRLRVGPGYGLPAPCQDLDAAGVPCGGMPLYYLNGQKADPDGTISVKAGEGVSVSSGEYNGIPAVVVSSAPVVDFFMYRR